jgi:6-phosphogluconolactonase (cycloisomerase 2 family)
MTVGAIAMVVSLFALTGGSASAEALKPGAVFVLANTSPVNEVAVFNRASNGALTPAGTYPTGGNGMSGLGSQGALVLSDNGHLLFAVNAGSNTISMFEVRPDGLNLLDQAPSGGVKPTSLTTHNKLLYVLNASSPNIAGFEIKDKKLKAIPGSINPVGSTSGAQVEFSPDGKVLAVTEKGTKTIDTYTVDKNGVAGGRAEYPSKGMTPFGFAFDKRGHLIVSEAGSAAVSSYDVSKNGVVSLISASVPANSAACWIAISKNSRYAYSANGSGSISAFRIAENGSLSSLNVSAATPGGSSLDLGVSHDGKYLYERNGGFKRINAYSIQEDGSLTPIGNAGALPTSASGIAVW